ncbi:hypothetical protein [Azospirillum griseum]|uniref:Uncharacterized protein n=1 Tax=Azospirillum griseum TaxID=2496639 RepID=A0A431VM14_9PROT|nr:hypothetical protein [Azospirillum griseum]RTR22483.1 hypothetical protein EJ903_06560 [Azospirillum griseum]
MNVASATSTAPRSFSFMTARSGDAAEKGAEAPVLSQQDQADPLVNRFPTVAFAYDADASRLVMQYRDPANGKTVSQIPTESALKQYKEARQQEKDAERATAIGLDANRTEQGGRGAAVGRTEEQPGASPRSSGGGGASGSSTGGAHVAHFTTVSTHPASAGSNVARVNVVI